jgi:hypothetical protein
MLAKMYSLETLREEIHLRFIRYERLLVGRHGMAKGLEACC